MCRPADASVTVPDPAHESEVVGVQDSEQQPGTLVGVEHTSDGVTLAFAGAFDMASSAVVHEAGVEHLTAGARRLTLDMSEVSFMDSTTISSIVRLDKRARSTGSEIRLVVRERVVAALIKLTGLEFIIDVVFVD